MRRGALLVAIGGESTFGLLHDEVIDRLRQPRRPLVLTVRDVPEDALEARRSEARTYAMAARGPTQTGDDRLEAAGPLVAAAAAALRDARFLPKPDVSQISSPPPPPSLKAPIATPPKSPDAAAARYFGDVDDDDDESDDTDDESAKLRRPKPYAVALEECGAALAALDDACARPTRSGRAARRALRVCEDALASGLCAAVECAEPARLGGGDGLPGRRGPRPGQAGHPAADTDDDARLAQLAVDCAALAGGGDGAALARGVAAVPLGLARRRAALDGAGVDDEVGAAADLGRRRVDGDEDRRVVAVRLVHRTSGRRLPNSSRGPRTLYRCRATGRRRARRGAAISQD